MTPASFILVNILFTYACVITWRYHNLDDRWINVCHTLGVSSRTPPNKVFDELTTVVDQSQIFDEFVHEQEDNDFEEVDDEGDVEPNPSV